MPYLGRWRGHVPHSAVFAYVSIPSAALTTIGSLRICALHTFEHLKLRSSDDAKLHAHLRATNTQSPIMSTQSVQCFGKKKTATGTLLRAHRASCCVAKANILQRSPTARYIFEARTRDDYRTEQICLGWQGPR